jgi:transcription factor IIIB subunit 2
MLSGGFGGGLDPPAFQRAERERVKKTVSKESAEVSIYLGWEFG